MLICIGLLGPTLDAGLGEKRWNKWRPTVSIFQQDDLLIDRFVLLHQQRYTALAECIFEDISRVSPGTDLRSHLIEFADPWDFEQVYAALHGFAREQSFDEEDEVLVHITTGTHVAQICSFLLTESRHLPGKLLQTSPPTRATAHTPGSYRIIDLDLSKYDEIFERFRQEQRDAVSFLKAGIETRNADFNQLIERIERVAKVSRDPILITGPTGAGKTQLARRIYDLKRSRRQIEGRFVEVNCATLRGDAAMSTLFGHIKGAYTGAATDRAGLLRAADGGVLFLDEIGELGVDEQAMLLRALESRKFMPVGSDSDATSDFQLLAGTNRSLHERVAKGEFREDLLARINLWSFELPGLKDRMEDLAPNLDFELDRFTERHGERVAMNKEARRLYLEFATGAGAQWRANFRDLNASVTRMATLAQGGRINGEIVAEEIARLVRAWETETQRSSAQRLLTDVLGEERVAAMDRFDRPQLAEVIKVCAQSRSLSAAGRELFAVSRQQKKSSNDADRLRKYLARFELSFADIQART